jgi:hypothetical protein
MPLHIQPTLRAREDAAESFGLIQDLDSLGVDQLEAAEGVTRVKDVPLFTVKYGTSTYTPS